MEICQHCGMYMKSVIRKTTAGAEACCEFCGQLIARTIKLDSNKYKWVKQIPQYEDN